MVSTSYWQVNEFDEKEKIEYCISKKKSIRVMQKTFLKLNSVSSDVCGLVIVVRWFLVSAIRHLRISVRMMLFWHGHLRTNCWIARSISIFSFAHEIYRPIYVIVLHKYGNPFNLIMFQNSSQNCDVFW